MGLLDRGKGRPHNNELTFLEKIATLFIKPLLKHKPDRMETHTFLESLFHVDTRSINRYLAIRDVVVPGLFINTPLSPEQGRGYRHISAGKEVFVRKDTTTPEKIDIQFLGGVGKKDQVFQLTSEEWRSVRRFLKKIS